MCTWLPGGRVLTHRTPRASPVSPVSPQRPFPVPGPHPGQHVTFSRSGSLVSSWLLLALSLVSMAILSAGRHSAECPRNCRHILPESTTTRVLADREPCPLAGAWLPLLHCDVRSPASRAALRKRGPPRGDTLGVLGRGLSPTHVSTRRASQVATRGATACTASSVTVTPLGLDRWRLAAAPASSVTPCSGFLSTAVLLATTPCPTLTSRSWPQR